MTSLFIDMLGNKIASILETQKINEDYENKLKPTIKYKTKDFIDAICRYLSNSEIQECRSFKKLGYITDKDLDTVRKENPIKYIKNAANKYIEKYLDVSPDEFSTFLLNYKPNNNVVTQSGGNLWKGFKARLTGKRCTPDDRARVIKDSSVEKWGVNIAVVDDIGDDKLKEILEERIKELERMKLKLRRNEMKKLPNMVVE